MPSRIDEAARALEAGGLVVYPTDTLYGLAARALDGAAVGRLQQAKGRSAEQPLSLAVSSTEEIEAWAQLDGRRRAYLRTALPGPITVLLPASARARKSLPPGIVGATGTIGIRLPDHPVARELARRVGPITSTSANRHGAPAARSLAEARAALGDAVTVYLDGPPKPTGRPSTLIDLTGATPVRQERL